MMMMRSDVLPFPKSIAMIASMLHHLHAVVKPDAEYLDEYYANECRVLIGIGFARYCLIITGPSTAVCLPAECKSSSFESPSNKALSHPREIVWFGF